jgi:hypothetical protein
VPCSNDVTAGTQINALIDGFGWTDAMNPSGIAMAALQLWYYHYPVTEVSLLLQLMLYCAAVSA